MRLVEVSTIVAFMLVHGTLLVGLTWLATVSVLRRSRPAVIAAVWTVVLIRFLVPPLFPASFGYSSILRLITTNAQHSVVVEPAKPAQLVRETNGDLSGEGVTPRSYLFDWIVMGLFSIYGCLLAAFTFRSIVYVRRVTNHLRLLPCANANIEKEVSTLALALGLRRAPEVKFDASAVTPFVTGVVRTTLVVPEELFCNAEPILRQAFLIHELAHIRRGDILIRWVQNIARLLFFFWPPVWWACRRLESYAEIACDEWALKFSSINPEVYARALLTCARSVSARPRALSEVGLFSDAATIGVRLERIVQNDKSRSPRMPWAILVTVIFWGLFALSGSAVTQSPSAVAPPSSEKEIRDKENAATTTVSSLQTSQQGLGQSKLDRLERMEIEASQRRKTSADQQENRSRLERDERAESEAAQTQGTVDSIASAPRPSSRGLIDKNMTGLIDLNGDGIISDFEAGYSSAIEFRNSGHRDSNSERLREIEQKAQERQSPANRRQHTP